MTGGESGSKAPTGKEISKKDLKTGDEEQRQEDAEAPGMRQEENQKSGQAKDNIAKCKDNKNADAAKGADGISGSAKGLAKTETIEVWRRLAAGTQRQPLSHSTSMSFQAGPSLDE